MKTVSSNVIHLNNQSDELSLIPINQAYENDPLTKKLLRLAPKYIERLSYNVEFEAKTILHEIWWKLPRTIAGRRFKYLVLTNQLLLIYRGDTSSHHALYIRKSTY